MPSSAFHIRTVTSLALALVCTAASTVCQAAINSPVHWDFTSRKINASTYEVHMTATLDSGWRIFAQNAGGDGPVPTSVVFRKDPLVATKGPVKEVGRLMRADNPDFGRSVAYYENHVDFVQAVTRKGNGAATVRGTIQFMPTNDHQALPPAEVAFAISLD